MDRLGSWTALADGEGDRSVDVSLFRQEAGPLLDRVIGGQRRRLRASGRPQSARERTLNVLEPQTGIATMLDSEGHRLASNDDETIVVDQPTNDTEGHRLAANDDETIVVDEPTDDTEGHGLA